ncbi:MAG: hypothetical protein ACYSWU_03105 [Planctomycetota bacterium]
MVDEETNRGVPLVQLETTSNQTYLTDSNGYVAIDDPTLMGRKVFFHVSSHGYEYPKDGFGSQGRALHVQSNGEATLKIKRINIAERLYRITGAGIYRDSVKLGRKVPIKKPLLNASVTGQDTVQTVVKGDRVYWFWGDTGRLEYPLGQFNTSGAISILPRAGGLNPVRGINLDYFADASGFSRPMFKRENGVLIWVQGVFSVKGEDGEPKILTHYSRRKSLQHRFPTGWPFSTKTRGYSSRLSATTKTRSSTRGVNPSACARRTPITSVLLTLTPGYVSGRRGRPRSTAHSTKPSPP